MSKVKSTPTAERLRELFDYAPETGLLIRRIRTANRTNPGDVVGAPSGNGYLKVTIDGDKGHYVHRVIWCHVTGAWPNHNIDHIDGDQSNNRFENLRDVKQRANVENIQRAKKHNKIGILGVRFTKNRYEARITVDREQIYIGRFDSAQEAHEAYVAKKRELHAGTKL